MKHSMRWMAVAILLASPAVHAETALSPAGDGHLTVPVRVNGHGPYPFILDTGADGTAVYEWFAEQAHLPKAPASRQELSGQTGTTKVVMYRVDDLELERRHLRHITAYGFPNRHDAGREAGVLGNDFMDGALVVFDFPCRRVEIHDKAGKEAGTGAAPILAGIDKGTTLLTLPVTVNHYTGIAMLDTGSRETRLTPSFARAAGIDPASPRFRDGPAIYGANSKKMIPRNGPIGRVRFGGVEIADAQGQVIALPVLEEDFKGKPAMILGADLLGRYRLSYDHRGRKVWIQPSSCPAPG